MAAWRWISAAALVACFAGCASVGDFASDDPGLREAPGRFAGRFVVVSDADMAATAYADGRLEPLAGAEDALTLFEDGRAVAAAPASNSVISWPQVVDLSADGRFAFVVETRAPAPAGVARYDDVYSDFPEGARLTVLPLGEGGPRRVDEIADIAMNPQSVEATADYLIIASEESGAELVVVALEEDGRLGEARRFSLDLDYREDDAERRVRAIHAAPDGVTLAVNVANRRVGFHRLVLDASGLPEAVAPIGPVTEDLGSRLSIGKWTPDGRFFVVADTGWGEGALSMLFQGPGTLTVLRPPVGGDAPAVVSRVAVGRSPEGFGMSDDGRRLATVNMERTYLPEIALLSAWPGRRSYSVSLLTLDPRTGALAETDRILQAGVLPEDVIFDAEGDDLAVAVFHRRKGADRRRGFVDFFSIGSDGRLESQGVTQPVVRGAHDFAN